MICVVPMEEIVINIGDKTRAVVAKSPDQLVVLLRAGKVPFKFNPCVLTL